MFRICSYEENIINYVPSLEVLSSGGHNILLSYSFIILLVLETAHAWLSYQYSCRVEECKGLTSPMTRFEHYQHQSVVYLLLAAPSFLTWAKRSGTSCTMKMSFAVIYTACRLDLNSCVTVFRSLVGDEINRSLYIPPR